MHDIDCSQSKYLAADATARILDSSEVSTAIFSKSQRSCSFKNSGIIMIAYVVRHKDAGACIIEKYKHTIFQHMVRFEKDARATDVGLALYVWPQPWITGLRLGLATHSAVILTSAAHFWPQGVWPY